MNAIDEYISQFPEEIQIRLEQVRATIKKVAPEAEEVISYQMPAYKLNGILVFFAGYKNHIGFYPSGSGIVAFEEEISSYKHAKGSVQFQHTEKLPLALIKKITKYRLKENQSKAKFAKK